MDRKENRVNLSKNELVRALSNRKLLMDGAMGTMLQAKSLDEKDFRGNLFAEHN